MAHTQRPRPRFGSKPGRPKVKQQPKEDGARLRDALALLKRSQMEVAYHAGVSQRTLSQVINGRRNLGREDLRALARVGISADYLLGADKKLVPLGETREVAELERDIAARLARDANSEVTVPEAWIREALAKHLDGKRIMTTLLAVVREDLLWAADYLRRTKTLLREVVEVVGREGEQAEAILRAVAPSLSPPEHGTFIRLGDAAEQAMIKQLVDEMIADNADREAKSPTHRIKKRR